MQFSLVAFALAAVASAANTTSTHYDSVLVTVTSCGPEVTDCPVSSIHSNHTNVTTYHGAANKQYAAGAVALAAGALLALLVELIRNVWAFANTFVGCASVSVVVAMVVATEQTVTVLTNPGMEKANGISASRSSGKSSTTNAIAPVAVSGSVKRNLMTSKANPESLRASKISRSEFFKSKSSDDSTSILVSSNCAICLPFHLFNNNEFATTLTEANAIANPAAIGGSIILKAISVPSDIAIPTSACARAGASLIPSPTKAIDTLDTPPNFSLKVDTILLFLSGVTSAKTLLAEIPNAAPISFATKWLSPLTIPTTKFCLYFK